MEVSHKKEGSVDIIYIEGKMDISSKNEFESEFMVALPKTGKYVAICLEELAYIDSSGIGSLVKCMNETKNKKKELILYGPNQDIKKIFDIAKLSRFFTILTSSEFQKKFDKDELEGLI